MVLRAISWKVIVLMSSEFPELTKNYLYIDKNTMEYSIFCIESHISMYKECAGIKTKRAINN